MPMAGPGMFPPPGGGMPMFPMMPPPPQFGPPPRGGSGTGKTVVLILAVMLLAISILANVLLLGGRVAGAAGTPVIQETVAEGSADARIAVVPIAGVIDENMSRLFAHYLKQAERDPNVKALIIEIDSPGGSVTASDEIYARLLRFKQERKIPVVVSMGGLATSGGYYAACAADHIFAQETTLTGNIGVLMPSFNFSKLMQEHGIEERTIVSEGAKFKNAGSSFSPEAPHERQYLQNIADTMFTRFKNVVWQSRSSVLTSRGTTAVEQVADGRLFTATEAKASGLIDDIGYLDDVIAHVKSTGGLGNPQVVRYHVPLPGLFEVFFGQSSVGTGQARGTAAGSGVAINNGVNVNIDARLIDEMATPRVLYLWRGQ
jgi:protease-4